MEGMYQRLAEASHAGDVDELHRLLQEDNLLLHQPTNILNPINGPLHIAAAHGHAQFVKEILARKPEYLVGFNPHGHTALHIACANRHVAVVRELLHSNIGVEICSVRNKDGLLPIHIAAVTGDNIPILEELLSVCSEDVVRGLTCLGENILHLAVKSNCFKTIRFLVERMEADHQFLNSRDAKGNTILHLATAKKQLQTVKFLLDKEWTDANVTNKKGSTVLDVLLESQSDYGDLLLGEMIRAAGGTTTGSQIFEITSQVTGTGHQEPAVSSNISDERRCPRVCWKSIKGLFLRTSPPLFPKRS